VDLDVGYVPLPTEPAGLRCRPASGVQPGGIAGHPVGIRLRPDGGILLPQPVLDAVEALPEEVRAGQVVAEVLDGGVGERLPANQELSQPVVAQRFGRAGALGV
jgi:hypothetical protein